jgi:hypothetical protein
VQHRTIHRECKIAGRLGQRRKGPAIARIASRTSPIPRASSIGTSPIGASLAVRRAEGDIDPISQLAIISTYTKIFSYPTLEFAQCRMLWDDDLLRHGARHKNGLRANSTAAGVQRRCDSSKG